MKSQDQTRRFSNDLLSNNGSSSNRNRNQKELIPFNGDTNN